MSLLITICHNSVTFSLSLKETLGEKETGARDYEFGNRIPRSYGDLMAALGKKTREWKLLLNRKEHLGPKSGVKGLLKTVSTALGGLRMRPTSFFPFSLENWSAIGLF